MFMNLPYEFWLTSTKEKTMTSHSVCIHNLFYEKQLNLAIVINVKWCIIYKVLERRQVRDDWIMSPKHWAWVSIKWLTLPVLFSKFASWKHTIVNLSELNLSYMKVTSLVTWKSNWNLKHSNTLTLSLHFSVVSFFYLDTYSKIST